MIDHKRLELTNLIHRLEVISEVSAATMDSGPKDGSENDIGGNRPSGGVDWKADREPEFLLKSVEHFKRRSARCHTDQDFDRAIDDAKAAIRANTHTPVSLDPKPGDPMFRRHVLETIEANPGASDERIALLCGSVSRRRVNQIRREAEAA